MHQIHCRAATISDCETIVEFNSRLARETEGLHLDRDTLRRGVTAVLKDPSKGRYFVACRGAAETDEIVGQLMLTYEWSDWRNGMLWWLQSVYVAEPHRRQGVFRQLFATALAEAERDASVVGLRLYVERHNTRAQATYRSLGLDDAGYFVMQRGLLTPRAQGMTTPGEQST